MRSATRKKAASVGLFMYLKGLRADPLTIDDKGKTREELITKYNREVSRQTHANNT